MMNEALDWSHIHQQAARPILDRFREAPPAMWWLVGGLAVVGALVMALGGPLAPAGIVLLGIAGFIAWQLRSGARRATPGTGVVLFGTVHSKAVEEVMRRDVNETIRSRELYVLQLDITHRALLTEGGLQDVVPDEGRRRLTTDDAVYAALEEGAEVHAVLLPTGDDHAHFAVRPDGTILAPT